MILLCRSVNLVLLCKSTSRPFKIQHHSQIRTCRTIVTRKDTLCCDCAFELQIQFSTNLILVKLCSEVSSPISQKMLCWSYLSKIVEHCLLIFEICWILVVEPVLFCLLYFLNNKLESYLSYDLHVTNIHLNKLPVHLVFLIPLPCAQNGELQRGG